MIDTSDSEFSRRSLVKTGATVAAVGGVLAVAGPAAVASAATGGERGERPVVAQADHHEGDANVMVRVLDVRLGTLEVFTEHGHYTITDRALALTLARLGR